MSTVYIIFSLPLLPLIPLMSDPLLKAMTYSFIVLDCYTHRHTQFINSLLSSFNIVICVQSQPLRLATLSGSLSLKKPALPSPSDHQPPVALSRGEACENSPIPLARQQDGAVLGVSFRQRC